MTPEEGCVDSDVLSQKGYSDALGFKMRLKAAVLLDMAGNTSRAASLLKASRRDGTSGKQCNGCVSAVRGVLLVEAALQAHPRALPGASPLGSALRTSAGAGRGRGGAGAQGCGRRGRA